MAADYIRTSETEDLLEAIPRLHSLIVEATSHHAAWKWALIVLHNALHGALVCHLSGTAEIGALEEGKKLSRWRSWLFEARSGPIPEQPKLAKIERLVDRLGGDRPRLEDAGSIIQLSDAEKAAFETLHNYRNQFVHFRPVGWSIAIADLPATTVHVCGLIGRIISDGWALRRADEESVAAAQDRLREISGLCLSMLKDSFGENLSH